MTFKENYNKEIIPAIKKEFGYKNDLEAPKLEKVTINVGLGSDINDSNFVKLVEKTLTTIAGQKPIRNKARKSIAGFKIREGMTVGVSVTLRNKKMYDFVDKLINISLPRVRDFRGISLKSVDENGNLSIGIKEYIIFPEIHMDDVEKIHGLQMVITTTAKTKKEGTALFKLLGVPFKKK
ncbi:50S ribosomal protein L5 [Candidatus Falkowbacteria bacterium]|jgi:large subunit ribosomal protein L5|nr:50S ribosomal protein L5 [Candidatus Falkowbacteria bacterium]MBT4433006.1 50S ribosomal protein L5 [Candidatus Falkowbacteria bacterium]